MKKVNISLKELEDLKKDFELLNFEDVTMNFGGLKAIDGLSINLNHREILGLIGPNGAGKTTTFNMITGIYKPTTGRVMFEGRPLNKLKPHEISSRGVARTFQNIRLFSELSVLDNIRTVFHHRTTYGLKDVIFKTKHFRNEEKEILAKSMEFLKIFELDRKAEETAKNLPYGEQRRLEIARALATEPKLLLLDEPAAGMNMKETEDLMELIKWLMMNFDISIILIEHDMKFVMNICPRIVVLDYGKVIAEGDPEAIKNDPEVIKAYLGEEVSA
jgi:branched-chain amino acid transport system ATP-binding protein